MPLDPFTGPYANCRVVVPPDGLDERQRAQFAEGVRRAVARQKVAAENCDAILRVAGEVLEDAGRLVIPHEPAAAMDATVLALELDASDFETLELDTLWWLTWSTLRALNAAGTNKLVHGGLHVGAVFQDRFGRVKVGDFGIAPLFEAVLDSDQRALIRVRPKVQKDGSRVTGGVWCVSAEEDEADQLGWISPYFAHEILAELTPLIAGADQFALGTMLYLLGTRRPPYLVPLNAPTTHPNFMLEPEPFDRFRPEWGDALERFERDAALQADRPLTTWCALVRRLLSSEPTERFGSIGEALETAGAFAPDAWTAAGEALGEADSLLEAEEFQQALGALGPHLDAPLPPLWQQRLVQRVEEIEKRGPIDALWKRLEQGRDALDHFQADEAIHIAAELLENPLTGDEPELRSEAETLQKTARARRAGELDEFARESLEHAKRLLNELDLSVARDGARVIQEDPNVPETRRTEAGKLLESIERVAGLLGECERANAAARDGRLDEAQAALPAIDNSQPEKLAARIREIHAELEVAQSRRREQSEVLDQVEEALGGCDADSAEAGLASVPSDSPFSEIRDRRDALGARIDRLREQVARLDAVQGQLEADEIEQALEALQAIAAETDLPGALRKRTEELTERARTTLRERDRERAERTAGILAAAREQWEAENVEGCRARLTELGDSAAYLDDAQREEAAALERKCARADEAVEALDEARGLFESEILEAAAGVLEEVATDGLPAGIAAEVDRLRSEIRDRQVKRIEESERALRESLDVIEGQLEQGDVRSAESTAGDIDEETLPLVAPELYERQAALLHRVRRESALLDQIETIERAVAANRFDVATEALTSLPDSLPPWAPPRADAARERVSAHLDAENERLLKAAGAAADDGDPDRALELLGKLNRRSLRDEQKQRRERIEAAANEFRRHAQQIEALEAQQQQQQWPTLIARAEALLAEAGLPQALAPRLEEVRDSARDQLDAHREALDRKLEERHAELEASAYKPPRSFLEHLQGVIDDPFLTKAQRARATELQQSYERKPNPPRSKAPVMIALAIVLLAGGGGVTWFVMNAAPRTNDTGNGGQSGGGQQVDGGDDTDDGRQTGPDGGAAADGSGGEPDEGGETVPVVTPADLVADISDAYNEARRSLDDDRRVAPDWTFSSGGGDGFPATLLAEAPGFDPIERRGLSEADFQGLAEQVRSGGPLREELFPDVVTRFERAVQDAADDARADMRSAPAWAFAVANADPPWTLVGRAEGLPPFELPFESPRDLEQQVRELAAGDPEYERLFPPRPEPDTPTPPPDAPADRLTAAELNLEAIAPLLTELADLEAGVPLPATWEAWPDPTDVAAGEALTTTGTLALPLQPPPRLLAEARLEDRGPDADPGWNSISYRLGDEERVRIERWLADRARQRIVSLLEGGRLAAAHALLDRLDGGDIEVSVSLLARWQEGALPGYSAAGELDAETGYPLTLRPDPPASGAGAPALRLIRARPAPAFAGQAPEPEPSWLFYAATEEWQAGSGGGPRTFESFDAAAAAARERGLALPTRAEWTFAALTFGASAASGGFFDGLYEWLGDPPDGEGVRLVTGGCFLHSELGQAPGSSVDEILGWLDRPDVTQRRAFGDGLVGLRPVWRPGMVER